MDRKQTNHIELLLKQSSQTVIQHCENTNNTFRAIPIHEQMPLNHRHVPLSLAFERHA